VNLSSARQARRARSARAGRRLFHWSGLLLAPHQARTSQFEVLW